MVEVYGTCLKTNVRTLNLNSHFGDCYNKTKPKKKVTLVPMSGSFQLRPQESQGWTRGGPPSCLELDLAFIFPDTLALAVQFYVGKQKGFTATKCLKFSCLKI